MKNLILLAAVAFGMTFASCEKCSTCDYGVGVEQEYCSKDKDARDTFESACKAAGGTIK